MPRLFLLIALVTVCEYPTYAHELTDGVVERDCQIVIFPDRIEVQYSLEMNATTRDRVASAAKERQDKRTGGQTGGLPSFPTTDPAELRRHWDTFRKEFSNTLAKNIELHINENKLKLVPVRSETIEKHSTSLLFVLAAKHPVTSDAELIDVVDKNFAEYSGYLRVAMKGRRKVKLLNSNVPPIVSSLERTPWEKLKPEERKKRRQAKAQFFLRPDLPIVFFHSFAGSEVLLFHWLRLGARFDNP